MNQTFDLNELLEQIKAGASIDGKDRLTETVLQAELESYLSSEVNKNGKSSQIMKSSVGEFELDVPRDRNGSYEPQIVKKHLTHISEVLERLK